MRRKFSLGTLGFGRHALALHAAVALSLGAMLLPAFGAEPEPTVKIENFTFEPAEITVKAGTPIIFENDDDIPHVVVADDKKSFRSEALDTGDRYTLTLEKAGDFPYFCGMHPHMQGTIHVTP